MTREKIITYEFDSMEIEDGVKKMFGVNINFLEAFCDPSEVGCSCLKKFYLGEEELSGSPLFDVDRTARNYARRWICAQLEGNELPRYVLIEIDF